MTVNAISIKELEALPEEYVAEAPKSMFGAFLGIDTDVEREEEYRE